MLFEQITIVGVGLIGGSVGLAAKARGAAGRVVGVDRDPNTVAKAQSVGAIDSGTTDLAAGVAGAQLVVVCTPVDRIAEVILAAARHVRLGTYFTDGGSTKGNVVAAVQGKLPPGVEYVAAHPLAGAEKNGVEYARADLFANRLTILTPDAGKFEPDVRGVAAFWEALGSRTACMDAREHDRVLAATSHLPHAIASAVAGATPTGWLHLTAGGFRDVTRVAAGDPDLWAAIFAANRDATLAALGAFLDRMDQFRKLLDAGDRDGLKQWLTDGKQVRDALGT